MIGTTKLAALAVAAVAEMFAGNAVASSNHAKPKAVEWQVKTLVNKTLKFNDVTIRVKSVTCQSHGYPIFICKARLTDGTGYYWPTVVYKDDGSLKISGGFST